jgi:hypothetical protein
MLKQMRLGGRRDGTHAREKREGRRGVKKETGKKEARKTGRVGWMVNEWINE